MLYDIAIIGGGIHGAACAEALSKLNYKIIVLEQYKKPGLATSSKSSKLIHGGLRYLESAQFKLVHECLQQREYLLKKYPDLVKLVPFHIPVYDNSHRKSWLIRSGLFIYSIFSLKKFSTIKKNEWAKLDNLKTHKLKTVFQYFDAQTNDRLLTQAIMEKAKKNGIQQINDACFVSADCSQNSCKIKYTQNGVIHNITSQIIINAAGPWINYVLNTITPEQTRLDIDLVAGSHIIINGTLTQGMYYLEAPQDRRAVFVMPWKSDANKDQILIGTTESLFSGLPEDVKPTENEISYLLTVYNHYFNSPLKRDDVIDAFSG